MLIILLSPTISGIWVLILPLTACEALNEFPNISFWLILVAQVRVMLVFSFFFFANVKIKHVSKGLRTVQETQLVLKVCCYYYNPFSLMKLCFDRVRRDIKHRGNFLVVFSINDWINQIEWIRTVIYILNSWFQLHYLQQVSYLESGLNIN